MCICCWHGYKLTRYTTGDVSMMTALPIGLSDFMTSRYLNARWRESLTPMVLFQLCGLAR